MSTTFPAGWEPYADIRKIDFGMSFGIIATEAAECATVESTEQLESSQIEQTHDRIELNSAKYCFTRVSMPMAWRFTPNIFSLASNASSFDRSLGEKLSS